ncbi:protein Wnt-5b-like [Rhopalosiphum padi]|uniref:protein Wnt-5b-like n=1 Tax=Rhopalosiphum padi TaxID=40932 RepID=UPI00298D8273|nr:protein Wnt-5b-like [Rhopalosiphum padi]
MNINFAVFICVLLTVNGVTRAYAGHASSIKSHFKESPSYAQQVSWTPPEPSGGGVGVGGVDVSVGEIGTMVGGGGGSMSMMGDPLLVSPSSSPLPPALPTDPPPKCNNVTGLSAGQAKLCLLYEEHLASIRYGVQAGLAECRAQFLHRRWNCSMTAENVGAPFLGPDLQTSSREAAFVQAIKAAGVAHAMARACRDGRLNTCSCSRSGRPKDLRRDWVWGGCGDNMEYGYKFTKVFLDVKEKEKRSKKGSPEQGRNLMNLHNNEAGRRAVLKKSRVTCKCHGVSGSCSLITCWQQLPSIRELGEHLKEKYEGAIEVRVTRRGRLQIRDPRFSLPTASDLVYIDDSPNYCIRNITAGSIGTHGRECNRTSHGMDGCSLLCCGRGYNTQRLVTREKCECKFHWCCYVQCKTCIRNAEVHTCK